MRKLKDFKVQISNKDASMFDGELCVLKNARFLKKYLQVIFLPTIIRKKFGNIFKHIFRRINY